jgi:AcrR family transcriptional regulator
MIDSLGVDGLKMRSLAAEIGCDPMAIYHFVKNKAALLEAITEHLEHQAGPPESVSNDWRDALHEFARRQLAVAIKHPNAIPLFTLRVSENAATRGSHEWLRARFEELHLADSLAAVRLFVAGINGVLLYFYARHDFTSGGQRIARSMMRDMVNAICAQCQVQAG